MRVAGTIKVWASALRVHQWLKNVLIFLPVLTAHRLNDSHAMTQATIAFISMACCASAVYLINDLLDRKSDQLHSRKRLRPLAANVIPVRSALAAVALLSILSLAFGVMLPGEFLLNLGLYFTLTTLYSIILKRIVLLDVLLLAVFYTMRITAGATATSIEPSFWLLAFSLFLFFSLALMKRYAELKLLLDSEQPLPLRRGYRSEDLDTLSGFGTGTACMSVLVLALYIDSEAVLMLYSRPVILWLLCPLLLLMLTRLWLLARRGELHEDPVVFAMLDRTGQFYALLGALLLWFAV
tara:strand:+ start:4828 stop:5715 length:888 start_codon:yes stop_codon:yes gene_type:complete